jgi:hypothetical protein
VYSVQCTEESLRVKSKYRRQIPTGLRNNLYVISEHIEQVDTLRHCPKCHRELSPIEIDLFVDDDTASMSISLIRYVRLRCD